MDTLDEQFYEIGNQMMKCLQQWKRQKENVKIKAKKYEDCEYPQKNGIKNVF